MDKVKIFENDEIRTEGRPDFFFVVATRRKSDEKDELPIVKSLSMMNLSGRVNINVFVKFDNCDGLPSVYNGFMKKHGEEFTDNSIIVFIHDDMWINDVLFFDKIESASKHFEVIGACGGKSWDSYGNGDTPIIWTNAARKMGMSGFMIHAADEAQSKVKHQVTFDGRSIFASNYGVSPARTLTIDGCIMCFTKKAIDKELKFDESFKFHFYDIDICFSAFLKNITVGTSPILITHESLGYSVTQPQFLESQKIFMKKWFGK